MNHWRKRLMTALGGMALAAALVLVTSGDLMGREASALAQGTIYVDVDATGANDGSSWEDAYTTLQPALEDAEEAGGEIWVAAGTYKPSNESTPGSPRTATFQLINGVTLYGGFDPSMGNTDLAHRDWVANATILSAEVGTASETDNLYHVFFHPPELALNTTAVLDGFIITGGYARGANPHDRGGGMYNDNSSPTVRHCTFAGNWGNIGGGMANYGVSLPLVENCAFSENTATEGGGGMANYYYSSPTVAHSTFEDNSSYNNGGGMLNNHDSSPHVTNCTFSGNWAVTGAGMYNDNASSPHVTSCTFAGNTANPQVGLGGGMSNFGSSAPIVTNSIFWGNSAVTGGGMYNWESSAATVTNCTFWGNLASTGGAVFAGGDSTLIATNCVLWGGTGGAIGHESGAAISITYSDVEGTTVYSGLGNINENPEFRDPVNGDFHLLASSPCIDAGSNTAAYLPELDFEGDLRICDGDSDGTPTADMGVDEAVFHTLTVHTAGNGSGTVEQIPEDASLAHGTVVTLTPIADTGSSFTGWSGDAASTVNPITLMMDSDKVVAATFTLNIHTLDISYAGNGSGLVSLNAPGGSYDYGTIVALTAVANPGSSFIGWSGDAAGTANPVTLAMDADKAVTATFSTDQTGQLHRIYLPLVVRRAS